MDFKCFKNALIFCFCILSLSESFAQTATYPGARYISPLSEAMGGVTLPVTGEIGNNLFNNPAGLARNAFFKAEFLNLTLDANNTVLSNVGLSSLKMTGLGGMTSTLNEHPNHAFSSGFSNLTAVSWGGLAAGLLLQQRVRAYSDGTNVNYQSAYHFVPSLGYGLALARGVVRLGYSFQYVNLASGSSQSVSDESASFLGKISEGHGFSHNFAVNFAFPFRYLPTFSLLGRNVGGVHYSSGSMIAHANGAVGTPPDEKMSVDAAFNFTLRVSGELKSYWFIQYQDLTNSAKNPMMEKLRFGVDFSLSQHFGIRAGLNGTQLSAGLGYKKRGK